MEKNLVQHYNVAGAEAVVLGRVRAETIRAIAKHDARDMGIDLNRDLVKIMEELGEAAQASLDMDRYDRNTPDSPDKPYNMRRMRVDFEDEIVQVVSLSLRLLVALQKVKEVGHE
ncbi:MAG: hypothetical protein V3S55_13420 [Nitrospiraceae bacterium]